MSLKVVDDTEKVNLKSPTKDGTYEGAMGGTELMNKALHERVDSALLEEFNIIKSRVRYVDESKKNLLWLHDLWNDPEALHLKDAESRKRFEKLIFVSNWQLQTYNLGLGVPYAESVVLKNAIEPIMLEKGDKDKEQVRIIYHTTPHRGLNLLIAGFQEIAKNLGDKVHLDIYSSFNAYGWPERDEPYKPLFELAEEHPNMTYHGYQPNDVVRKALKESHIFAYPSTWPETSCIAALEAMSAGCQVVCPNYAALPETTGNWARMYQWSEDMHIHANVFANQLYAAVNEQFDDSTQKRVAYAKNWTDNFFNWDLRAAEWTDVLQSLK